MTTDSINVFSRTYCMPRLWLRQSLEQVPQRSARVDPRAIREIGQGLVIDLHMPAVAVRERCNYVHQACVQPQQDLCERRLC